MAGVAKPAQFEGVSAWPLITGEIKPSEWKAPDFIYEYFWEPQFPMTPTTFAIERNNLKYIQYYGIYDINELYDVAKDPEEMHNLIDDPAYAKDRAELREALFQQLANNTGHHMIPFGKTRGEGVVFRKQGGSGPAEYPGSWMKDPKSPENVIHD
jgi:arylsulfatase A-like enzyme